MTDSRLLQTSQVHRRSAGAGMLREIASWEDWLCEDERYEHSYDQAVTLYVRSGRAVVTFGTGDIFDLQPGDAMTIQPGTTAVWKIAGSIHNSFMYHEA